MAESWTSPKLATVCRFCTLMCGMKDQHIQSNHLSNFMNRTVSPPACSPFGQHIVAALSLSARLSAELDLLMKIWKKKNSKVLHGAKKTQSRRLDVRQWPQERNEGIGLWIWWRSFREESNDQKEHKINFYLFVDSTGESSLFEWGSVLRRKKHELTMAFFPSRSC